MKIELSPEEVSIIINSVNTMRLSLDQIATKSVREHLPNDLKDRINELLEIEVKLAPYMECKKSEN